MHFEHDFRYEWVEKNDKVFLLDELPRILKGKIK
jgi:hypothetical protein